MVSIADTGATKSVHNPKSFPDRPVAHSQGSKCGDSFADASGGDVPMLGQRVMEAYGPDGSVRKRCGQVADVAIPLTSVGEMCDEGKIVAFGKDGWAIWDAQTGTTVRHPRVSGTFCLEEWIPPAVDEPASGFTRQE